MKYLLYAFDFDLTLADTVSVSEKTYAAAFKAVGKVFDGDVFHHLTRDLKASFTETNGKADDFPVFLETFERTSEGLFETVTLYPDVLPYIFELKKRGVMTALVTNRNRRSVDKAMKKYLPLEDLFDYIVTGDTTENFKPHPEPVLKCLAAANVSAKDAVYIGDAANDYLAAKAAGVDFIYIDRHGKVDAPAVKSLFEIE